MRGPDPLQREATQKPPSKLNPGPEQENLTRLPATPFVWSQPPGQQCGWQLLPPQILARSGPGALAGSAHFARHIQHRSRWTRTPASMVPLARGHTVPSPPGRHPRFPPGCSHYCPSLAPLAIGRGGERVAYLSVYSSTTRGYSVFNLPAQVGGFMASPTPCPWLIAIPGLVALSLASECASRQNRTSA